MVTLFILVFASYYLSLLILLWGWSMVRSSPLKTVTDKKFITVLVPFRNEEKIIHHLIHSLNQLDYPADKFEVIFIDDHSEDKSVDVINSLINERPNHSAISLHGNTTGKKQGIDLGVSSAKGEIIVTTDADCELPKNWLIRMNEAFEDEKVNMALGGVKLAGNQSFFSSLQAIEFASLIGSMAAALGLKFFLMGNAANMAFRKFAFQFVNGYQGNLNIPSGDDEFLARKILNAFPDSVCFINAPDSVVTSRSSSKLKDFVSQRLRWAGKWRYNSSLSSRIIALYIVAVQITFVSVAITLLFHGSFFLLVLLGIKVLLECLFLYTVSNFLDSRWNWVAFIALQFIYPIYVLAIGIVSQLTTYDWKGRSLSHKA